MYMIKVTLDKGPGPRQIKLWFSLHNIIFEGKPIGLDQKKILKESSWFEESKRKLRSKVVHFFVFFHFFLIPLLKFCENEKHAIEDIVESTLAPPFWTNFSRVDVIDFVDPQKVVARMNAFLAFELN